MPIVERCRAYFLAIRGVRVSLRRSASRAQGLVLLKLAKHHRPDTLVSGPASYPASEKCVTVRTCIYVLHVLAITDIFRSPDCRMLGTDLTAFAISGSRLDYYAASRFMTDSVSQCWSSAGCLSPSPVAAYG
jgi:hypothetical protein